MTGEKSAKLRVQSDADPGPYKRKGTKEVGNLVFSMELVYKSAKEKAKLLCMRMLQSLRAREWNNFVSTWLATVHRICGSQLIQSIV